MTWTEGLSGLRGHTSVGEGIWPEEAVCCADVVEGFSCSDLSERGHLARGTCVLCRCRGGMFMVLTPTPSSLPLSTEKCSAQQQGLESLPEELPDTSSSQAVPTSCT